MFTDRCGSYDYEAPTVPCELCATPTRDVDAGMCAPCWDLYMRIRERPILARAILRKIDGKSE